MDPVYNLVNQKSINVKPTPKKKYALTETKLKKWVGMGGTNLPVLLTDCMAGERTCKLQSVWRTIMGIQ